MAFDTMELNECLDEKECTKKKTIDKLFLWNYLNLKLLKNGVNFYKLNICTAFDNTKWL